MGTFEGRPISMVHHHCTRLRLHSQPQLCPGNSAGMSLVVHVYPGNLVEPTHPVRQDFSEVPHCCRLLCRRCRPIPCRVPHRVGRRLETMVRRRVWHYYDYDNRVHSGCHPLDHGHHVHAAYSQQVVYLVLSFPYLRGRPVLRLAPGTRRI